MDGTIERSVDTIIFRYERQLSHPPDVIWKAITDPAEIERWTGNRPEIDLVSGGSYVTFHGEGVRVVDRITALEPQTVFEHTFWVEVNPGALVRWELGPEEESCLLTLMHTLGVEDVRNAAATVASGDASSLILSRNGAGWHRLLDRLAAHLEPPSASWSRDDQEALRKRYENLIPAGEV